MVKKDIHIIHAPVNLGLSRHANGKERGCDKLPDALKKVGFHSSLDVTDTKIIPKPTYPEEKVYNDGALNGNLLASYSIDLADAVEEVLDTKGFPVILGGDCSILVGNTLALARKGRFGLIHLDAHPDYYHKGNRENAVVGGMALAIITGKGTDILSNLEHRKPYIYSKDVLTFGYRESDPEQDIIAEAERDGITCLSAANVKREGLDKTTEHLNDFVSQEGVDGYWLHLDADVLDASIMPCVDCPEPNGLQFSELKVLLKTLLQSHKIIGMNVTILDPELDNNSEVTKAFSDMLIEVLK
ncbi:arginase family protein [Evansella halocellulosilytica]|uniref:arginase family protein n=1 Tax=Evansella halocellulosilytica TaxID=2011013 RepID=UPI001C5489B9|nr:arginase family protein [Evansella halocellulosilytica]